MSLREQFTPSSRLSFLESSRHRPHGAALSCKWSLLIRIRTLINLPAELSRSSRRLTSLILPIQNGRTNGPGSPATVYPPTIPRTGRRGEEGRSPRGKTMTRPSTLPIFIHKHCPRGELSNKIYKKLSSSIIEFEIISIYQFWYK